MTLKLYNSLTREKQTFTPIDPAHIRIYACGPTVYNYAHIGNARMAVVFDVLARILRTQYPKVTYASNITDVDDKIMNAAIETGEPIERLTKKFERIYNEDMAALGVAAPDIQPRATDHIGEMIALMQQLIENGHAYAAEGHVLFDVPSYPAYGALSGRSRDEQIAGARVEIAPYKRDAADFILWKPSAEDQPGWPSPWGRGRPGWHIECSAMSEKHLGLPFDIHGGGADLKFPHHENEIAQSACAHGHKNAPDSFAKYWVHNGFVTVDGEKMSKSLGNVTLVHNEIEGQGAKHGTIIRMALLSAHYRKPLDWNDQILHQSTKLYEKIEKALARLRDVDATEATQENQILTALRDDLNTPLAYSKLSELITTINKADEKDLPLLKSLLQTAIATLGIEIEQGSQATTEDSAHIDALVIERNTAKANKDWQRADEIRDQLAAQNIEITDTPNGTTWRKL